MTKRRAYKHDYVNVKFSLKILTTEKHVLTKLVAQQNKEDKQRNVRSKKFHMNLPLQINSKYSSKVE